MARQKEKTFHIVWIAFVIILGLAIIFVLQNQSKKSQDLRSRASSGTYISSLGKSGRYPDGSRQLYTYLITSQSVVCDWVGLYIKSSPPTLTKDQIISTARGGYIAWQWLDGSQTDACPTSVPTNPAIKWGQLQPNSYVVSYMKYNGGALESAGAWDLVEWKGANFR